MRISVLLPVPFAPVTATHPRARDREAHGLEAATGPVAVRRARPPRPRRSRPRPVARAPRSRRCLADAAGSSSSTRVDLGQDARARLGARAAQHHAGGVGMPAAAERVATGSIATRPVERRLTLTLSGSTSENSTTTSTPAIVRGRSTRPSVSAPASPWRWNCSGAASSAIRRARPRAPRARSAPRRRSACARGGVRVDLGVNLLRIEP